MIRYVTLLRFTEQGAKNLSKSTSRAAAFKEAASKAGVRVEAQYWTVGACDGVLMISAEDEKKALSCLASLSVTGNVRTETLRALDENEFQAIAGK